MVLARTKQPAIPPLGVLRRPPKGVSQRSPAHRSDLRLDPSDLRLDPGGWRRRPLNCFGGRRRSSRHVSPSRGRHARPAATITRASNAKQVRVGVSGGMCARRRSQLRRAGGAFFANLWRAPTTRVRREKQKNKMNTARAFSGEPQPGLPQPQCR